MSFWILLLQCVLLSARMLPGNRCTQVRLWTHSPVPFLAGEYWVRLLFSLQMETHPIVTVLRVFEMLQAPEFCMETHEMLEFDSQQFHCTTWFPPHLSLPIQVIHMLKNNEVFFHLDSVAPFPLPWRKCLALELMWSTGKSESRRGFVLLGWSSRNAARGSWEVGWRWSGLEK